MLDERRAFMVKVQHKGRTVGQTFISIYYSEFVNFDVIVYRVRQALKQPPDSDMRESPAVSHRIQAIFVEWHGASGKNSPLIELTERNCYATFQEMAKTEDPYNLEVIFEECEEMGEPQSYSPEENGPPTTAEGWRRLRDRGKPL